MLVIWEGGVVDEPIVVDNNVITGMGLGTTIPFALELVKKLLNKEKSDQIKKAICCRFCCWFIL